MADIVINTANTLSPFVAGPGQDKRFPITSSDSVFTFGDFKIQRPNIFDNLELISSAISFSNFSTLLNFSSGTVTEISPHGTPGNELNPDVRDPNSYSYFGSFYTKVSRAINSVIQSFPYAILADAHGTANTVYNYSQNDIARTSLFRIPLSSTTNQGNVIFASGVTDTSVTTLYNNFNVFSIQFSGTANTENYEILDYSYTTGATGYMEFEISGFLFTGTTTTTAPIYIRPTPNNYSQYQRTISNLEYQLAFDGTFKVPDNDDDSLFQYKNIPWPRTIDGFNIDTYGSAFDTYKDSILSNAQRIDEIKTSWMVRTMLPDQFIELDTDTQIYQKLTDTFADEFDTIKSYIDNLSFMHSVTYDRLESVPDKFMYKLSRLLAFDFHDGFSDSDIFEYFLEEDNSGKTLQDYNLELWRKMLRNIVWLYKKKGTRDAIMFLFKIMGAPDALINFNEFVYQINNVNNTAPPNQTNLNNRAEVVLVNNKVADDGYINFDASTFIFQEGGPGRGNGQDYVNQWHPEFHPNKIVDNSKIYTGDTLIGTRNIMNSKEAQISINTASAIETDVFDWYKLGFSIWNWGSTGMTISPFTALGFSGMTVPYEWTPDPSSIFAIMPTDITGMTVSQWMDYIYASNINPTNRKTVNGYPNHNSIYFSLKKIYMTYMLWTNSQDSNRLTFKKLEHLLDLLERNFFKYLNDFVPSTTILESTATVYRNTVFERQKFVYPEGINLGSEFKKALPAEIDEVLDGYSVSASVNEVIEPTIPSVVIQTQVANTINLQNQANTVISSISTPINTVNYGFTMNSNIFAEVSQDFTTSNMFNTTISNYTSGNTVIPFYGNEIAIINSTLQSTLNTGSMGLDNIF